MSGLISAENAQFEVFPVRILRCRSMASNPRIFSKRPFIAAWLSLASLSACGSPELPAQTGTTKSGDGDKAVSPVETEENRRALHQYLQGRYLYQQHCTECHGETGRGNGPWAAELEIKPRNFRTGLFKLRTTPYGMLPVEEDLIRTIKGGISGTSMPVFGHLPDADIRMIIKYLQSLSRSWKDPSLAAAPLPIPEVPGWFSSKDHSRQQEIARRAHRRRQHHPRRRGPHMVLPVLQSSSGSERHGESPVAGRPAAKVSVLGERDAHVSPVRSKEQDPYEVPQSRRTETRPADVPIKPHVRRRRSAADFRIDGSSTWPHGIIPSP